SPPGLVPRRRGMPRPDRLLSPAPRRAAAYLGGRAALDAPPLRDGTPGRPHPGDSRHAPRRLLPTRRPRRRRPGERLMAATAFSLCLRSFPGASQALLQLSRATGLLRHVTLASPNPASPEIG